MTLAVVMASIAAYIFVGVLVARASLPARWTRALRQHYVVEESARKAVLRGTMLRVVLWPALGPYDLLARTVDAANPKEQERQIAEREGQIAERDRKIVALERQLGLK